MTTQNSNLNNQDFSKEAIALLDKSISTYNTPISDGCETLIWELLGSDCDFAEDNRNDMKNAFLQLLVLFTHPDISSKIQNNCVGEYLKRVIDLLENSKNPVAIAQLKQAEIEFNGIDKKGLEDLKSEFVYNYLKTS
jgi:hypothetical protein